MIAADPQGPFRELFHYDVKDAPYFFGRDEDSRILLANLMASRVTVVFGASGAGKSSVLRAGVIAQVHRMADARRARGGSPELAAAIVSGWSGDPAAALREALAAELARSEVAAPEDLRRGGLRSAVAACAGALDGRGRGQVLLILDQFEEYFLYHPADVAAGTFAADLAELIADRELPVSVLIALREDAIGKLDALKGGIPDLFGNLVRVEPLERAAAGEAIHQTVKTFNALRPGPDIELEEELVREVLDQVQIGSVRLGDAGGLAPAALRDVRRVESSFLQLVMARVWREELRKGSVRLTARTLRELGKADRIVRDHVDAKMATLSARQQDGAAEMLGYLVTSGGAKISYTAPALAERTGLPAEEVQAILEALSAPDTRILRKEKETYELFHDVLAGVVLDWRRRRRAEQQQRAVPEVPPRREPVEMDARPDSRLVMVISGRNKKIHTATCELLRNLGLMPLDWSDLIIETGAATPHAGEVLEAGIKRAQAAVILLTPDDEAHSQPSPDLLFEAGMVTALIPGRTVFVQVGDIRPLRDLAGRPIVRMDNSSEARLHLARQLERAGCTVSLLQSSWRNAGDFSV